MSVCPVRAAGALIARMFIRGGRVSSKTFFFFSSFFKNLKKGEKKKKKKVKQKSFSACSCYGQRAPTSVIFGGSRIVTGFFPTAGSDKGCKGITSCFTALGAVSCSCKRCTSGQCLRSPQAFFFFPVCPHFSFLQCDLCLILLIPFLCFPFVLPHVFWVLPALFLHTESHLLSVFPLYLGEDYPDK